MALFQEKETHTLHHWVTTIRQAGADHDIAGLILIVEQPEMKLAQVEELTRAIQAFKAKNKPVYCYMDEGNNVSYALAASASHITLAENSDLETVGLRAELMYYKGLMDKLGVEADMLHCGAYKSALEPFTRTEPSPEAAENINWLLDGLYDRWIGLIAEGRKLQVDEVKKLVDSAPLSAADALKAKLVDEVSSFPAFKQMIHKEFGKDVEVVKHYEEDTADAIDTQNPFAAFMQIFSTMAKGGEEEADAPGIALIYVDGGIVVGKSDAGSFGGGDSAGSTTIRAALEQARTDENVRAVVLRVDSPGGSALASDIIWKAAERCGKEKPLFVTMGGVAGSGGYYVSLPADTIFAEASTITGSIGVVGGKIVLKGLLEGKLGLTTTQFLRGAHAGLMSSDRKWTDDERAWMTKYMNDVYEQFKGRVMTSRGDKLKKNLDDIAGGRVYTGQQALGLGLVDQLGGLSDALDFAAKKTGLGKDYKVYILPKPSGFAEFVAMLQKMTGEDKRDEFQIAMGARLTSDPILRSALPLLRELAPAQLAEALRALRDLVILQRERVGCFMPAVPQIR
jgi:protease IV